MKSSSITVSLSKSIHTSLEAAFHFLNGCPVFETHTKFSIGVNGVYFDITVTPSGKEFVMENHVIAIVLSQKNLKIIEIAVEKGSIVFFGDKVWYNENWSNAEDLHSELFMKSTAFDEKEPGFNPLSLMSAIEYNRSKLQ